MTKLLENQTSLILWGGRGIGRAVTLALARNGSAVAFVDPDSGEVDKVGTLLFTKKADSLGITAAGLASLEADAFSEALDTACDQAAGGFQFFHRAVICAGMDARFWGGSGGADEAAPGAKAGSEARAQRLDTAVQRVIRLMAGQKSGERGHVLALWPLVADDFSAGGAARAVQTGMAVLNRCRDEAARRGIGLTIVRIGASEANPWSSPGVGGAAAAGTPAESAGQTSGAIAAAVAAESLRLGEIADAIALLATMPRRVLVREIVLSAWPDGPGRAGKSRK